MTANGSSRTKHPLGGRRNQQLERLDIQNIPSDMFWHVQILERIVFLRVCVLKNTFSIVTHLKFYYIGTGSMQVWNCRLYPTIRWADMFKVNGSGVGILRVRPREFSFLFKGGWYPQLTADATQALISGFSFGYSAFINGQFLGSGQGSSHSQDGVDILSPVFNFTASQLVTGDNGTNLSCRLTIEFLIGIPCSANGHPRLNWNESRLSVEFLNLFLL